MLPLERHSKAFWILLEELEIYLDRVEILPGSSSFDACVAALFLNSPVVELSVRGSR